MAWKSARISANLEAVFAHVQSRGTDLVWLDSALGSEELGQRSLLALELEPWFELQAPPQSPSVFEGACSPIWQDLDRRLEIFRRENEGCPTGIVGFLSYEAGFLADNAMRVPDVFAPVPLLKFAKVRVGIVVDSGEMRLVACADNANDVDTLLGRWLHELAKTPILEEPVEEALRVIRDEDAQRHQKRVSATLEAILDGRVYQGCLTYPVVFHRPKDMASTYRRLRRVAPADFCAFVRFGDIELASTSPERFFDVDAERWTTVRPMKGTRRRGSAPDDVLVHELRSSLKDRSENVMIVDLMRNDLGRVCEVDSISVPSLFDVEVYANVLQMTSTVQGRLEQGVGPFQALRAMFPPGSMTGAPKIEACSLIQELEQGPRGIYSGTLGWMDGTGRSTFSVVIRALQAWGNEASWHVGGGIVWGSTPEDEWNETRAKAATILSQIESQK